MSLPPWETVALLTVAPEKTLALPELTMTWPTVPDMLADPLEMHESVPADAPCLMVADPRITPVFTVPPLETTISTPEST